MKSGVCKIICACIMLAVWGIPVQAQEVVTVADTDIYMFNPMPNKGQDLHMRDYGSGLSCGPMLGGFKLQQYVPQDTVTIYGVALTMRNTYQNGSFDSINPKGYRAVMMERATGTSDDDTYPYFITRTLQYVDSITLHPDNIKQCLFRYDVERPAPPHFDDYPCVEFYFNTPMKINRMTDTFYVGREFFAPDVISGEITFYPSEFVMQYNAPPLTCEWWTLGWWDTTQFNQLTGVGYTYWGFAFPIIGFRCKPVDSLQLIGVYNSGATVQWHSVEEGAIYNVRLTSSDGSIDSMVVTTDTIFTFYQLPQYKRYNIQVRKQCHYATVNYDTMVYSPWMTANNGFILGNGCPSVQNMQVEQLGDTVTVTWDDFTAYSRVLLRYGPVNLPQTDWQEVNVTGDTMYTITDLLPGARYGVTMQSYCEYNETETPWCAVKYFYTTDTVSGGGDDSTHSDIVMAGGVDFAVSPNPVHGVVEVTLPQPLETDGVLSLYDLGGREVRQTAVPAGSSRVTLDTEGCPAGAYLLKLISPQGIATRRLLVK